MARFRVARGRLASGLLRKYADAALAGGKDCLGNAVDDEVRVAADGRREVGVARRRQREVALVLLTVSGLAQRTEHEMGEDTFLRLARYFDRQLLIHTRSHGNIFRDLILARLLAPARPAAPLLASLRLHGHSLHRQRTQAERVAKAGSHSFKFGHPAWFRLFVNSIQ
jgi:hypothetical protein